MQVSKVLKIWYLYKNVYLSTICNSVKTPFQYKVMKLKNLLVPHRVNTLHNKYCIFTGIHTALTEGGRSDVDIATPTRENVLFPNKAIGTAIPTRNASTILTHKLPISVLK